MNLHLKVYFFRIVRNRTKKFNFFISKKPRFLAGFFDNDFLIFKLFYQGLMN